MHLLVTNAHHDTSQASQEKVVGQKTMSSAAARPGSSSVMRTSRTNMEQPLHDPINCMCHGNPKTLKVLAALGTIVDVSWQVEPVSCNTATEGTSGSMSKGLTHIDVRSFDWSA